MTPSVSEPIVHRRNGLLYAAEPASGNSWIFNRDGLLRSAVVNEQKFKRGWSGDVITFPLESDNRNHIRKYTSEDRFSVIERVHRQSERVFNEGNQKRVPQWDSERYRRSANTFKRIYGDVPILPPDQYRSMLLNLTTGCSFNKCSFCDLYSDLDFQVRPPYEFKSHLDEVLQFFQSSLSFFNGTFLGEGDALSVPTDRLVEVLRLLEEDSRVPSETMNCFGMGHAGRNKTKHEFERIAEAGLNRVYLGLETGSEALLRKLNKPFTLGEFTQTVQYLKCSELDVGIIMLLGPGGKPFSERHPRDTVEFLSKLPLGETDRLFLSPLSDGETGLANSPPNAESLCRKEREKQAEIIQGEFSGKVPVVDYDIDRFLY